MEKIKKALSRSRGILVTDFDGTLTLSGSSLHGAVHVLGEDSGLAMGKDRIFQTLGKSVLSQAKKARRRRKPSGKWQRTGGGSRWNCM